MRVVHCRREPYDVYVGRPSKWGNPFILAEPERRDAVIYLYKSWLCGKVKAPRGESPPPIEDIRRELKGKILGCWCAPNPCHADVLLWIANPELIQIETTSQCDDAVLIMGLLAKVNEEEFVQAISTENAINALEKKVLDFQSIGERAREIVRTALL